MATLVSLNLYCSPEDVYDYLGTEGAQLRLDDHRLATGQQVTVTADAAVGATTLAVSALSFPLLRGSTLVFDGAGMATTATAVLTAAAAAAATSLTVSPLTVAINATAAARDSGVNVALAARLVKGCQYGTSQVKLYCSSLYDDSALQTSWSVNRWSTIAAARWVAKRLCRACPQSIESDWEAAIEELRQVRTGMLRIEDIPTRTAGWPFISNVTVDIGYAVTKVRVEPQISELTPTQFPQRVDWNSALILEF